MRSGALRVFRQLLLVAAAAGAWPARPGAVQVEVEAGEIARLACREEAAPAPQPQVAATLLPGSRVAAGRLDILQAWLGAPTGRYGHAALGSTVHAGNVQVLLRGQQSPLVLALPPERVFEDRLPRLVDLDGDGRDELILVEAHARQGASLVVYGVDHGSAGPRLVERARSEPVGTMRWLNPVGAGDFEPGAALEIAAVVTPHLGGVLTLYRYEPPRLVVLSRLPGPANHRMGSAEQQLSAVLHGRSGPLAVVPSGDYSALLVLHWVAQRGWSQAAALRLPAALERVEPRAGGACVALANGAAWQLRLR